jgi:hypothetical protein
LEQASAWTDGADVEVSLDWRALRTAPGDYTVFVHVVGDQPQPLVQADGYPLAGLYPPNRWRAGDVIHDQRRFRLAGTVGDVNRSVLIGLYDRAAPLNRAVLSDAAGNAAAATAVRLAITSAGRPTPRG